MSDKECSGAQECNTPGHLCKIVKHDDFDTVREIVKDSKYYCEKCGRAARQAENLCRPAQI